MLKTVAQYGGLAGIVVGILLLVFRRSISGKVLSKMSPTDSARAVYGVIAALWSIGVLALIFSNAGGDITVSGSNCVSVASQSPGSQANVCPK